MSETGRRTMKKTIAAILLLVFLFSTAAAEETAWIICKPDSFVNVRQTPNKRGTEIGRLELGDQITLTGRTKNGFSECEGMHFESTTGWIFTGYLVDEEPEQIPGTIYRNSGNGRTALRRWVNGPRRAWAKNGDTFRVYAKTETWALTSKGFIRTEYIDPEEEQ